MKKVLDKALEAKIKGKKPEEIITLLKELQDAGGLKICQNVTVGDVAYREVK